MTSINQIIRTATAPRLSLRMSKSRSGLNSVKRDWSCGSGKSAASSQEIYWPPTPPQQGAPADAPSSPIYWPPTPPKKIEPEPEASTSSVSQLTGKEKRRRDIHYALSNRSSPAVVQGSAWTPAQSHSDASDASYPSKRFKSAVYKEAASEIVGPLVEVQKIKALASIFLSEEQRSILELVERGTSLFYTGSAGIFMQP
jgi:hypothetical protein